MPSKPFLLKRMSVPSLKNPIFCVLLRKFLLPGFSLLISCADVVLYNDMRIFVNILDGSVSSTVPGTW